MRTRIDCFFIIDQMKKLRTLLVKFENELSAWETPAFRGAVIEKVGRENILFNHHVDDKQYLFRYPLIQYKSIQSHPAILCLGEGVEEIHKLFNKSTWEINLKGEKTDLVIDKLDLGNFTLNVWDKTYTYTLTNWLALSEENFAKYKLLQNNIDRIEMLEKILTGNILAFAKGVDWHIDKEIKLRIDRIVKTKNLKYKDTHLLAFDINISTNVFLPNYIGLGKGASHGYGMMKIYRNNKNSNNQDE